MACVAAMVDFSAANESIPYANGNVVTRRHVARSRTSARKQRAKEPRVGRAVACETLRLKTILLTVLFLLIIISIILAFVHVCWGNCDDGPPDTMYPLPPSPSRLHKFQKAAVCTDGPPCSAIGRDILMKNGSAIDATIAAMFCNGLVNMQSMGLGGGFLMTVYIRDDRKAYTLNAREAAPLAARANMFEKNPLSSKRGPLAVAVPGELRGYQAAHDRFGKLPWRDLIEPTIRLCNDGYNMTDPLWTALFFNNDVKDDPLLSEWFVDPKTNEYRKGIVRPKKYCETLEIIAEKGGNALYEGELSHLLIEDIKEMGGIIRHKDLVHYEATWEPPIAIEMSNQDTMYSVRPPGSGALLALILNVLDGYSFTDDSIDGIESTALTFHRIIETFKYAYAQRTKLGDPNFSDEVVKMTDRLVSLDYAASIRQQIDDLRTFQDSAHYGAVFFNQSNHGTAHISVMAPNGDAVSVTSSINLYFGAGVTSKQTGIVLNSCMDDFSSTKFNNFFGLPGSPVNQIIRSKRPQSSMTPTIIVDRDGDVKVVIGASGGTKITTAVALMLVRYLWFGQTVKEAIDAPRFHHQLFPMHVEYEYGNLKQVLDLLRARGHVLERYRDRGSVICALVKENGTIAANADFRKGGDVYGLD